MAILLAAWLATASAPSDAATIRAALDPAPAPGYVMHAVRVGVTRGAKRSTFIADKSLGPKIDIAFAFWVLRGFNRVILIDTGFVEQRHIRAWRIEDYRDPTAALAALDLEPKDVTDVVITHGHWDHIGGLVRFPDARIWIDRRTLAGVKKKTALAAVLRAADDDGRLRRTTNLETVIPHAVVVHTGMHTAGFQYLVVANHDGIWVFASDIVPLRANFEHDRPTGLTTDAKRTRAVMATMRALVSDDLRRIVTGHEPGGFDAQGIIHLSP